MEPGIAAKLSKAVGPEKTLQSVIVSFQIILVLALWNVNPAQAQQPDLDRIEELILALPQVKDGNKLIVQGQLYSGLLYIKIEDGDGIVNNLSSDDQVLTFWIHSMRSDVALSTNTKMSGDDFEAFIRDNLDILMEILFPTCLGEGTTGKDLGRYHSQQFLMDKVLGFKFKEQNVGGLIEYEWFELGSMPGAALQGVVFLDRVNLSIQGRYANMRDYLGTKSGVLGIDYFPHLYYVTRYLDFWAGIDLFASGLFSSSSVAYLGQLNTGMGVWAAVRRDVSRIRLGLGSHLQISKSFIPTFATPDDYEFLAEEINKRGPEYNLTYGAILGFALSRRVSLNGKITENHALALVNGAKTTSQTIVAAGVSYLFGLFGEMAPLDVGLKINSGLDEITAYSIFVQGNYRW